MRRLACLISLFWLLAFAVRADEGQARELFSAGTQAMLAHDWPEAVRLLEASLAQRDKAACRFNLVVANRELKRPLEVARHAVAFLAAAEQRAQSQEATEIRTYLNEALRQLVTLEIDGLPLRAQPKIDGGAPAVTHGTRIYELPGLHRLELWVGDRELESIEIELGAGAVQPWPRVRAVREPAALAAQPNASGEQAVSPGAAATQPRAAAEPASEMQHGLQTSTRKKLAWTLGLSGAATGLGAIAAYGYAARRVDELRGENPMEPGYLNVADAYGRAKLSVMPLAFVSGALLAAAAAFAVRKPRAARAVSIASLIVGVAAAAVGTVLMVRQPEVLVDDSDVGAPSREAGSLCLGAALPLLTYGVRLQWGARPGDGR